MGRVLVVFVRTPAGNELPRKAPVNRSICPDQVGTKDHTVGTGLPHEMGSGVRGQGSGVRGQRSEVRGQKPEVRGEEVTLERYLFSSLQSSPRTRSRMHFNNLSSSSPLDESAIHSVPPNPSVIPSNRA